MAIAKRCMAANKKYLVSIEWWTEVEASSIEEAIEKGSDDWFLSLIHI